MKYIILGILLLGLVSCATNKCQQALLGQGIATSVMMATGVLPESAYQGDNGTYWIEYLRSTQRAVHKECAGWK